LPEVKTTYKFGNITNHVNYDSRPPVKVSLGPHFVGASRPHPDSSDPITMMAGARKRFAFKPPDAYVGFYGEMAAFTLRWCEKNLTPLSPDCDLSVETWLSKTKFNAKRKDELRKAFNAVDDEFQRENLKNTKKQKNYTDVKLFMKDESYPEYKHGRGINSRTDPFKCFIGPTIKAIEEQVYKQKEFIKHIPVQDRAEYIFERLYKVGATYVPTDYTAFESLFTSELFKSCEFVLYNYMTRNLPSQRDFMKHMASTAGRFLIIFKYFTIIAEATRMSGEMNTSLGNGFSNLMFFLFACYKKGSTCVGVVEGDDGLFSVVGEPPTVDDFKSMGLVIKMDVVKDLNRASFCGCVFDLYDKLIVCDPFKVLMDFGYTKALYFSATQKTYNGLLLAKAYSLFFQYPGCPVLQELALYIIRVLNPACLKKNVIISNKIYSAYEIAHKFKSLDMNSDALLVPKVRRLPTPMNTRLLVEEQFGFPIHLQLLCEEYFKNKNVIEPIDLPAVLYYINNDCRDYFNNYTRVSGLDFDYRQTNFRLPKVNTEFECIDWVMNSSA
jgi:hypothetical protein